MLENEMKGDGNFLSVSGVNQALIQSTETFTSQSLISNHVIESNVELIRGKYLNKRELEY